MATRLAMDNAGGGTWVTALRAARTAAGFSVTYIAPDAVAFGLTYQVTQGVASVLAQDTMVESSNAVAVGSAALGNIVLVVSERTGQTAVKPYTGALSQMGAGAAHNGLHAIDRSLVGARDDSQVLLLTTATTSEVSAVAVSATGNDVGTAVPIVPMGESASAVSAIAGASGYVASWLSGGSLRAEVVSAALAVVTGPVTIATSGTAFAPVVGWAAAQNRGLAIWQRQDGSLWAIRIDAMLRPVGAELQLSPTGSAPRVASDGNSFWVVWHDTSAATKVAGAHVTAGGTVTPFALAGSGGTEVDHDVVALRDGTVQIIWFERAGTMTDPLLVIPGCRVAGG